MKRVLRRYKVKSYRRHNILAVDFENDPKTGKFICAGVYGETKHDKIDYYFTDQGDCNRFLDSIRKSSCIIVTFNLSYDRTYMDQITDHKTVLATGTRVITLKLRNGIKVFDLSNHVDGSLEDWIGYVGMLKRWGIRKAKLKDHYQRVMNDAKATYYLGEFLQDFYNFECGVSLQTTVASAAMKVFCKRHFFDYWENDDDRLSVFERQAYYGGRCELYQRGEINTWSYDVNSMYIGIMRDCQIPDPDSVEWVKPDPESWFIDLNYLGIWHCKVKAPSDLYLPVLPVRIDGKLKFPLGEFTGTWTSIELQLAIEKGYEILDVFDAFIYRRSKIYFRSYADFIWRKRQEFKQAGNRGMELMIKKLGNSLYGKFGQRNRNNYFGRIEDYPKEVAEGTRVFRVGRTVWIEDDGELVPAMFEFPCVAAFIAAYARIKLYRGMDHNSDNLIYCDTDGMKLSAPARGITIGNGLGEWDLEVANKRIEYHRPKLYGAVRKGVPKRATMVSKSVDKMVFVYDKPLRYKEAIKAGKQPNTWVQQTKVLMFDDNKRSWEGDQSRPLQLNEGTIDKHLLV